MISSDSVIPEYAKTPKGFFHKFTKNRAALIGLGIFCFLVVVAIFANFIAPYNPFQIVGDAFVPPSPNFPFGTDDFGRDCYSAVIYGSRVSLFIGTLAGSISTVIGVLVGAFSGYAGGKIDEALMRITETFMIIPDFILALVLVAMFGASLTNVVLAIGVVAWPSTARLVRAEFLTLKEQDFVTAAKALGAKKSRIIFFEILPNAVPPIIINSTLLVGMAIITEAGLSFLGLSDPRVMTWGWMLGNAELFLRRAWWMSTFPGLAILATVLSLNLIGDGLNDALNPRLREA